MTPLDTLEIIINPLPPSEDGHPFSARLKRGYLLRFFVVSLALAACAAAVVVLSLLHQPNVAAAALQSVYAVVTWVVLVSLELQVDALLARHSQHGMPKNHRVMAAWLGNVTSVRRLNRVLLTIYAAIAVFVFLFSTGLLSLIFTATSRYITTPRGVAETQLAPIKP